MTLTTRATDGLDDLRATFGWVRAGRTAVVAGETGPAWWTFAGLHANAALMAGMGPLLGGVKVDNLAIKLDPDVASVDAVRAFAAAIDSGSQRRSWIAEELAQKLKFADCLPDDIAIDVAVARIDDPAGITRVREEPIDDVLPAGEARRPASNPPAHG